MDGGAMMSPDEVATEEKEKQEKASKAKRKKQRKKCPQRIFGQALNAKNPEEELLQDFLLQGMDSLRKGIPDDQLRTILERGVATVKPNHVGGAIVVVVQPEQESELNRACQVYRESARKDLGEEPSV
jgi:hypothetical protein